jgi:hypothetical protein
MEHDDQLGILTKTIADHVHQLAHEEWDREYGPMLASIVKAAGLTSKDMLDIDGRAIPSERIWGSLREAFIKTRTRALIAKLTEQVVWTAFKTVLQEGEG